VDTKLAPVNVGTMKFNETIFVKNQKYESGVQLEVKIHVLFLLK
jgi:hypothetical protein